MKTTTQGLYLYSHTIGIYALQGRGFNNPVDLAIGRNGVMYVLNRAGPEVAARMPYKRVSMCTVDEEYLGDFSSGGVGDGQMMWPSSIALDREGNVYISDEALQCISIFDSRGRFIARWGVRGSRKGEFDRPAGIAYDGEDNLLVVDSLNNRVQRFTRDGRYLGGWGRAGDGEGEFNVPWGIATDHEGDVYVADWRNDRIQRFDADGRHIATYGRPGHGDGEFHRPAGVCVDEEGRIYVADWGNERVQVLDHEGRFIAGFRGEAGLSRWAREYFSANQREFEERQRANMEPELDLPDRDSPREQSASLEKLFWGPTAVKTDDEGRLFVADSCRHRIQIYRRNG